MSKIIKLKPLILSIVIPLAVGGVASLLSLSGIKGFENLNKPAFTPPGAVFPIAWTILYILMGISCYIVYISKCANKTDALKIYALQLFLNFLWPIFFFGFKLYWFAFVILLALLLAIGFTIYRFYYCEKKAAYLMVPYFLWVLFAGILNFSIALLN